MFDCFLMEGCWYVVKVRNRRHVVYLKTHSKTEARLFFARLEKSGASRYAALQARGIQNAGMGGSAGLQDLYGNGFSRRWNQALTT